MKDRWRAWPSTLSLENLDNLNPTNLIKSIISLVHHE